MDRVKEIYDKYISLGEKLSDPAVLADMDAWTKLSKERAEIEEIAQNGPKAEDIEKTREYLLKDFKNSLEQNGSWMQYLNAKYGSGLDYLADYEREVRGMSYADIQNLAKQILSKKECIKVMMRPETAAKAE